MKKTPKSKQQKKPPVPIIWSFDPGKENFAYARIDKGRVTHCGTVINKIEELKSPPILNKSKVRFLNELRWIMERDKGKTFIVGIERFMSRGGGSRGNLQEMTCMMIGMVLSELKLRTFYLITAAQWKNFLKACKVRITDDSLSEHEKDAICIGIYVLYLKKHINKTEFIRYIRDFNRARKKRVK